MEIPLGKIRGNRIVLRLENLPEKFRCQGFKAKNVTSVAFTSGHNNETGGIERNTPYIGVFHKSLSSILSGRNIMLLLILFIQIFPLTRSLLCSLFPTSITHNYIASGPPGSQIQKITHPDHSHRVQLQFEPIGPSEILYFRCNAVSYTHLTLPTIYSV